MRPFNFRIVTCTWDLSFCLMLEKLRWCYARAQFSASAKFIYFVQEEFDDRCDLFLKDSAGVKVCKVIPLIMLFYSFNTNKRNKIYWYKSSGKYCYRFTSVKSNTSFSCFNIHSIIGMQELGVTLACNFIFYVSVVNNNNIIIIIILLFWLDIGEVRLTNFIFNLSLNA